MPSPMSSQSAMGAVETPSAAAAATGCPAPLSAQLYVARMQTDGMSVLVLRLHQMQQTRECAAEDSDQLPPVGHVDWAAERQKMANTHTDRE